MLKLAALSFCIMVLIFEEKKGALMQLLQVKIISAG